MYKAIAQIANGSAPQRRELQNSGKRPAQSPQHDVDPRQNDRTQGHPGSLDGSEGAASSSYSPIHVRSTGFKDFEGPSLAVPEEITRLRKELNQSHADNRRLGSELRNAQKELQIHKVLVKKLKEDKDAVCDSLAALRRSHTEAWSKYWSSSRASTSSADSLQVLKALAGNDTVRLSNELLEHVEEFNNRVVQCSDVLGLSAMRSDEPRSQTQLEASRAEIVPFIGARLADDLVARMDRPITAQEMDALVRLVSHMFLIRICVETSRTYASLDGEQHELVMKAKAVVLEKFAHLETLASWSILASGDFHSGLLSLLYEAFYLHSTISELKITINVDVSISVVDFEDPFDSSNMQVDLFLKDLDRRVPPVDGEAVAGTVGIGLDRVDQGEDGTSTIDHFLLAKVALFTNLKDVLYPHGDGDGRDSVTVNDRNFWDFWM